MTWLTPLQAVPYMPGKHGPRFIKNLIATGKLRGARIGGRREYVTAVEWIHDYLEAESAPVIVNVRRRA